MQIYIIKCKKLAITIVPDQNQKLDEPLTSESTERRVSQTETKLIILFYKTLKKFCIYFYLKFNEKIK